MKELSLSYTIAIFVTGIIVTFDYFILKNKRGKDRRPLIIEWSYFLLPTLVFIFSLRLLVDTALVDLSLVFLALICVTTLVVTLDLLFFKKKRGPERKKNLLTEWSYFLLPTLIFVFSLRAFIGEPFQVPSGSMNPTVEVGDFIVADKFSYGVRLPLLHKKIIQIGQPKRGDIIVFRFPGNPRIRYLKRVIGIPGDKIEYTYDKHLLINNHSVSEIKIDELNGLKIYRESIDDKMHTIQKLKNINNISYPNKWIVPANHYFVLGDNRDNSNDSRYWGMVPDQNIIGKALFVWMNWSEEPGSDIFPKFSKFRKLR